MKSLCLAAAVLLFGAVAAAHVNDEGMDYRAYKDRYGQLCCGAQDCRPVAEFVETAENGVRLLIDGTWISVSNSFVIRAPSTDGRAHFCGHLYKGNPAEVKAEPYCVILPPRDT
jgi:hypothetical protein